jgi:hypothetical protein
LLPGLFSLCVWLWKKVSHSRQTLKGMIATQAQGLIPLGLMAWIAFTLSFALPKLSYVLGVINDPLGLGWHVLGISAVPMSIDVSAFNPVLEVGLILVGAIWAASITLKIARSSNHNYPNLPVLAFYAAYSTALMWLLVG